MEGTQLSTQMEELKGLVLTMQKKQTEIEQKGNKDCIDKEVISKMQKDVGDMGLTLQEAKAKISEMEKSALRMGTGELKTSTEYAEALNSYIRFGKEIPKNLISEVCKKIASNQCKNASREVIEAQAKALETNVMPNGGYFITPERIGIINGRIFETSPLRQVANVRTTTSNEIEAVIDDNEASSGGWVGEQTTPTNTNTPQIGLLKIPVHEQYANPTITQTMLEDAGFDIEGWLAQKIADKLSREENTAFISGNGVMKPRGIISYPAWTTNGSYERYKVEQWETAGSTTVVYEDLIKLQGLVKEPYQAGSVWLMKRDVWANKILTLKDSSFYHFVVDKNDPLSAFGKKIILCDDLTGLTAGALVAGTFPIIYGNFGVGYTIVDKLGITLFKDFSAKKPYIEYYTRKRVGGAVTNFESFKLLKIKS
jgi:HK97 family phage major capsid protein